MAEKTIYLPIVFHFHQPVDNFDAVIEDCYIKAYKPLLENLYKFKDIKFTLHFSGNLLEWFIENKPDYMEKIEQMAKRGQIEIIGGGYYEPIYAIIPDRDKIAQMNKLSELIKSKFGLKVNGAWLSERVWEPNYPSFLNEVGLKYVIVDDNHFKSTGITKEDTLYSYVTEDNAKLIRIFPINEELRYLAPWKPSYMFIDQLKEFRDEKGDRMALFISDAEKMGVWGTTHKICYVEGEGHVEGDEGKPYIPQLLKKISKSSWIKTIALSDYMEKYPPKGLVYLPTASYDKMEEWVLPTEVRKRFEIIRKTLRQDENNEELYQFLKGGFWRYFLVKYPESNNMHKKMLYVREKMINLETELSSISHLDKNSDTKNQLNLVWDEIYKAQCNDCYWHGLFGGVYLTFLRFSVYTHLINAEKMIENLRNDMKLESTKYPLLKQYDFSKNGRSELLLETEIFNLYFDPHDAGTLFELDYKPTSYNLLNTLTRWPEAYHESEEIEDTKEVMNDRYRKSMLRIRIFHDDVSLEQLERDEYFEFGSFADNPYLFRNGNKDIIEFYQEGNIKDPESDERYPFVVSKTIRTDKNKIIINVKINSRETKGMEHILENIVQDLNVGIDLPFFFNGNTKEFRWESKQAEKSTTLEKNLLTSHEFEGSHFKAFDGTYNLSFETEIATRDDAELVNIFRYPIVAYAITENDFKKIYQGINLFPIVKLKHGLELTIKLSVN